LEELTTWRGKAEEKIAEKLDPLINSLRVLVEWLENVCLLSTLNYAIFLTVQNCESLSLSNGKNDSSKVWTGEFLVGLVRVGISFTISVFTFLG
jgi:hypothetical protein